MTVIMSVGMGRLIIWQVSPKGDRNDTSILIGHDRIALIQRAAHMICLFGSFLLTARMLESFVSQRIHQLARKKSLLLQVCGCTSY